MLQQRHLQSLAIWTRFLSYGGVKLFSTYCVYVKMGKLLGMWVLCMIEWLSINAKYWLGIVPVNKIGVVVELSVKQVTLSMFEVSWTLYFTDHRQE